MLHFNILPLPLLCVIILPYQCDYKNCLSILVTTSCHFYHRNFSDELTVVSLFICATIKYLLPYGHLFIDREEVRKIRHERWLAKKNREYIQKKESVRPKSCPRIDPEVVAATVGKKLIKI